jgi:hypothetical protein
MDRKELFSIHRSSKRINEGLQKVFGKKINFENFTYQQLEDARNKIRTQLSQARSSGNFNENLENDAFHQAQFMLDAILAEISEREKDGEIITTESEMTTNLEEGEIQQAQSIVSAKTMVDRVGRWIEELSGMENDSLLQLGDQIRDEMGADMAKKFISSVAPAIEEALSNLKQTRETLSNGVRLLTGEDTGTEMLGGEEPAVGDEEIDAAAPDQMNMSAEEPAGGEVTADDFGAADAAVGGGEAAGREQRESVNFQNRLLKVLAG